MKKNPKDKSQKTKEGKSLKDIIPKKLKKKKN